MIIRVVINIRIEFLLYFCAIKSSLYREFFADVKGLDCPQCENNNQIKSLRKASRDYILGELREELERKLAEKPGSPGTLLFGSRMTYIKRWLSIGGSSTMFRMPIMTRFGKNDYFCPKKQLREYDRSDYCLQQNIR